MKIRSRFIKWSVALAAISTAAPCYAYDWAAVGKVTKVESTYMPTGVVFTVDVAAGSCAAGQLMTWTIQGADATARAQNAQATYALLLTALSSGRSVEIFGTNAGCAVQFLIIK